MKGTPEELDKAQSYLEVARKGKEAAEEAVETLRVKYLPLYADSVEAAKVAARQREAQKANKGERESAQDATYGAVTTVTDARDTPF